MDNYTLLKVIKSDFFLRKLVIGVYSQNEIPSKLRFGQAIIINIVNGEYQDGHWACAMNVRPNYIDYLDSCQTDLKTLPNVYQMLRNSQKKIYTFPRQLQNCTVTSICGGYTLFFLYAVSRGFKPKEILAQFFPNSRHDERNQIPFIRDIFVSRIIRHLLPALRGSPPDSLLYGREEYLAKKKEKKERSKNKRVGYE